MVTMKVEQLERKYIGNLPKSAKLAEKARRYIPGGDTHGASYHPRYDVTFEHGEGC